MHNRHKVFISYHHHNDQQYKDYFIKLFGSQGASILVDHSVDTGDIDDNLKTETIRQKIRDDYIREASVIIVLIGTETWKRKHVDWEISSGIRRTQRNPRCGLLGIFLPSYPLHNNTYKNHTIPPRLYDNKECNYAKLHLWSKNHTDVSNWIHEAFNNRDAIDPDNHRDMFGQNRTGSEWQ